MLKKQNYARGYLGLKKNDSLITVKLMGGIGNQMFQYALGRHLSILNKSDLILDCNFLKSENKHFTIRKFQLEVFNIKAKVKTDKSLFLILKSKFSFGKNPVSILEKSTSFNPDIFKFKGNIVLDGYWQSEKYFKNIENIIRDDFSFRTQISAENKKIEETISSCNSVSVHVRRGDYVSNPLFSKIYGTCSVYYYLQAVNFIKDRISDPMFFIFSDDIQWARINLNFLGQRRFFVDVNNDTKCYEDLRLMSLCKHNIIANSSFSWWGAWLNINNNKFVVAPRMWVRDKSMNNDDLLPESWIKL